MATTILSATYRRQDFSEGRRGLRGEEGDYHPGDLEPLVHALWRFVQGLWQVPGTPAWVETGGIT